MNSYALNFVYSTPWALLPEKLALVVAVAERHARGETLAPDQLQALTEAAAARTRLAPVGAVAVLPVVGTLIPRGDMLLESSGAVSAQRLAREFRQLVADPNVGAIVLDVDSPGGSVAGIAELADEVYRARGQKPVVAVANHLAASAAYWVAAAADEVIAAPGSMLGSIGVYAAHTDVSEAYAQLGVKVSLISAGKFKVEGNPYEPLGEEARGAVQALVNDAYDSFTRAVARGRGVKAADVREGFGQGRVLAADEAVAAGLADRVETIDAVVARLARGAGGRLAADLEMRQRRLRLAEKSS